jgi:hypothetical protein
MGYFFPVTPGSNSKIAELHPFLSHHGFLIQSSLWLPDLILRKKDYSQAEIKGSLFSAICAQKLLTGKSHHLNDKNIGWKILKG